MIEPSSGNSSKIKPVGIIYIPRSKKDSGIFHRSLRQVGEDVNLIQTSILECANVGCSSIWICCDEEFQPMIREIAGNFVKDPISVLKSNFTKFPRDNQVEIPIYYYMVHPRDRTKRAGPVWDVLNTCLTVYHFSKKISRWVVPEKYYITGCFGVHDPESMMKYRKTILGDDNVMFTHKDLSFLDDEHLPFTLDSGSIKNILYNLKNKSVFSSLTQILFSDIIDIIGDDVEKIEINEYYPCYEWVDYTRMISSFKLSKNYDVQYLFSK